LWFIICFPHISRSYRHLHSVNLSSVGANSVKFCSLFFGKDPFGDLINLGPDEPVYAAVDKKKVLKTGKELRTGFNDRFVGSLLPV